MVKSSKIQAKQTALGFGLVNCWVNQLPNELHTFWSRGFQPIQPQSNQATDPLVHPAATLEKGSAGGEGGGQRQTKSWQNWAPSLPSLPPSWLPSSKSFVPPNFTSQTAVRERNSVARVTCKAQEALERLRVSSTFNPPLWRIIIVAIPFQLLDIAGPHWSKEGTSKCIRYWFLHKRIEDGEDISWKIVEYHMSMSTASKASIFFNLQDMKTNLE